MVEVMGKIRTARFLACFNQDHAVRMRQALLAQRQDGSDRTEDRVSVVGTTAAIQPIALQGRRPGAATGGPSFHRRLLVEMPVDEHGGSSGAGNVDIDHWSPIRQLYHLD